MKANAFFAYPDSAAIIADTATNLADLSAHEKLLIKPWKKMNIVGLKLDDLIRDEIAESDVFIADVTYLNFNVLYELGYAIGRGLPVVPTINIAVEKSVQRLQEIGLFDTLGWATYSNADELCEKLRSWRDHAWSSRYIHPKDHAQPLFLLDCLKKTDFRNHIVQAIENSQVRFRSYDPLENPRLTAAQAVSSVSASAGVIVPIIAQDIVDSQRHNLRAAFVIGLSHGFGLEPLPIQYGHGPAPLDYRDFITNSTFRHETMKHVDTYCAKTLVWNQQPSARSARNDLGILGQIDLGSPAAENETSTLAQYFIKTAEYARALRAEGAVVIGRKGSGKSAIYFQVSEVLSREKIRCVVDLRPASHNLSEMRESLLGVVNIGIFDHTVAAFWQYVIYVEMLLKVRELLLPRAKNDFALQERLRAVEVEFKLDESVVSSDFTSRLDTAIRLIVTSSGSLDGVVDRRSHLTNILFEKPIPKLREAIASFHDMFEEYVILIDDLDKGWPPRQVEPHDISTIRHLIEVLGRIQRDLIRRKLIVRHLVFLRSDIYERLVEVTSDRGKYNVIKVDWSDPEQLRHLLWQRVVANIPTEQREYAWDAINPPLATGETSVDKMIEASLRRPRFLIDLCERTLSFAINRGHGFVVEADLNEGIRQMSLYLVSDFGYEMRDIAGTPEDIFYSFIGVSDLLTETEVLDILNRVNLGIGVQEAIDLLLWYGFLGIIGATNRPVFIYDRAYDFRRLEAERGKLREDTLYAVNPAFLLGLERR